MTEQPKMQYPTPELIARLNLDYFRGSVLSLLTQGDIASAETLCLQAHEYLNPANPTLSNNFTSYELGLYASANNLTDMLDTFKLLMKNDWADTLRAIRKLKKQ